MKEDPLEKGMVTHSSTLAWRIPRTEEPRGLQSTHHQESDTTERLNHQQDCAFVWYSPGSGSTVYATLTSKPGI